MSVKAKIILYTQRVEIVSGYGERRDCADQNIARFIEACGYLPVPVPNIPSITKYMVEQLRPVGLVLTGGNSLTKYGGDAPERDQVERELLKLALQFDIPTYGFCRGMQVIADYFGCELEQIQGHVAVRHEVHGKLGTMEVNSFHNQACCKAVSSLTVLAQAEDGVIEAIRHKEKPVLATMWHPEREEPFRMEDVQRIRELFG